MFFGIIVEPGKKYETVVEQTFHLSMACIEPSKNSEPVSLFCKTDEAEEEYLLCSLDGQQTRQVTLDLLFVEGTKLSFSVKGAKAGKVHLTGYLAPEEDDMSFDEDGSFGESEDESVSEEELSPASLPAGQKRAPVAAARPAPPSKKAKTQDSPAQAANGKPAANGKAPVKEDSDDEEDDSDEDDMSDDGELQRMLAGLKKAKNASPASGDMSIEGEDEEDDADFDEDDEDDDEDEEQQAKKIAHSKKEIKQNLQQKQPQKQPQQQQHQQQAKKPQHQQHQQMNQRNTPGNTPGKPNFHQKGGRSPFGGNRPSPNQQGGGFKKDGNSSFNKNKQGLIIEDVVQGHGPVASKGRLVTVGYVGRMADSGKEFDRNKSFSFRLGRGEVIKGWDIGLESARVGCKRKLTVPAHLAYGSKGAGPIPPNSKLSFEVEVKSIK